VKQFWVSNFSVFFLWYWSERWLFLNYDLFVESARKIVIRQFMESKSISDSQSVEINSDNKFQKWVLFNQHRKYEKATNVVADSSSPFQTHLCGVQYDNDIYAPIQQCNRWLKVHHCGKLVQPTYSVSDKPLVVNLYSGVRLNFKDSLRWLLWLVKAHSLLSMQQPSTVHLY